MQRKDAVMFEGLVNVEQGRFARVMRQPGAAQRPGLGHDESGPGEFLENAPDHDRICVYALCNLFGFKGFFA